MPPNLPDSDLQALMEQFASLYVPGVTPLAEEQARKLQAGARTVLHRLQEDPLSADLSLEDGDKAWRSLPDSDQTLYREHIRRLAHEIVSAEGTGAIDQVMQEHYLQVVSWARTAKLWEKLGGDLRVQEFPGDGPVLQSTARPEGAPGGEKWLVRTASQAVQSEWLSASGRDASAADSNLNHLVANPLSPVGPIPAWVPLQGSLGRVKVGGRELKQWEISSQAFYVVDRSQRTYWSGELVVLYAPEPSERVVWLTTARLVEHLSRTQRESMQRRKR